MKIKKGFVKRNIAGSEIVVPVGKTALVPPRGFAQLTTVRRTLCPPCCEYPYTASPVSPGLA